MNNWKTIAANLVQLELPLARLDAKQQQQLASLRPLPAFAVAKLREALALEWTYNSNAIEGNTLTLPETRAVIEDGITIGGKSLREHLEAINHHEAIELVTEMAVPGAQLTERMVLDLHALVQQKIEKEWAGRYRTMGVRIAGAPFTPPDPLKVPELMQELLTWLYNPAPALHPLLLAAAFHHRFVWIHPFMDGNGRTVRLAGNLLLMAQGYPPAIVLKQDRRKYYNALNEADAGNMYPLCLLLLQACERSIDIYLSNLRGNAGDYKPIGNLVEEETLPYGEEYISLLARRGKIDAYKEGKTWYTTKEAIEAYRAGRKRMR
ncbi:MAG TPA: Fic family protein [Lacibacter sp.]|nr:Fic family protein [Lacibacter sp.]HMO88407.1 Fic family protein [Lacibacter sp.]HMP86291.1 Fic family protein [Lacibacter sp.]